MTTVGSIKSTSLNGVKIYSVSGQRSLPSWLPPKKLKALRKDREYLRRVDLIQDLKFETATTKIKVTPDGEYLISSGIYPPQVKVFELREMSLKFERHLVSEVINFEVLGDDYSKIAFLCADRSICLHAKYGSHYSLRIPRMGRDMKYDSWSCDLLCAASSPDLYRINLEQGRFLSSISSHSPAINVVCRSKIHGLVACGGEDGFVECFDMRKKSSVGRVNSVAQSGDSDQEITAVQFDEYHGFLMAVGSSAGKISIYDLRMSDPIRIKDHMYGRPILDIKWHQTLNSVDPKLISSDSHVVRVWDPNTGDNLINIEPSDGTINDVCVFRESGLMLMALDCSQTPAYFIPNLGPAPKWCSYLENLTEEMEEGSQTTIYDDYKFLTMEDLERLHLTNLIGTNLLRAYMHGFFIDYRLFKKAQAIADPFAYEAYIEKKKQEKIEAERASRITIKRKLPKVNRLLAARLLENQETEDELTVVDDPNVKKKSSRKKRGLTSEILKDERFIAMFENKDFEVDEESREYLSLHPQSANKKKNPSLIEEYFDPVMEDEEVGASSSDASESLEEGSHEDGNNKKNPKRVRLYEAKDERHAEAFWNSVSLARDDALPLGERAAELEKRSAAPSDLKLGPGGSREISFSSKSSKKQHKDEKPLQGRRRGIKPLGLKPSKAEFYGRKRQNGRSRGR